MIRFPTELRKMWTGREVQEWLDEHVNKDKPCCAEYESTPVKGIYHNPKCENWVLTD